MQYSNESTLGIVLAAGKSTRLYPATLATTKQLVPVYDKPLIYYPLTSLMLAGVRDVLFITNESELPIFQKLLGDGYELGMNFEYTTQDKPEGIAQALTIANAHLAVGGWSKFYFKKYKSVFLILGDNLFHGAGLSQAFRESIQDCEVRGRAQTFFQRVKDPERFGVGVWDENGKLTAIEEKPREPKSKFISVGSYIYPMNGNNDALIEAGGLKPSARGEYEITDLNNLYIKHNKMNGVRLARSVSWFDCGTYDSLLEAAMFVKTVQDHQGFLVGSPHEVAFLHGNVPAQRVADFAKRAGGWNKNGYNQYLLEMCQSDERDNTSTR